MVLIDLTHTSHTTAQTGIQRVCRSLFTALGAGQPTEAITYDPFERNWRKLAAWERSNLSALEIATKRGARWPFSARLGGRARRLLHRGQATMPAGAGLVVPEVFSPVVAVALPELFKVVSGSRIAFFHDAIALKYPELSPQKTVARFPRYLRELLVFDAVCAVSEDSRTSLVDYWRWLGVTDHPPVQTLSLPLIGAPLASAKATTSLSPPLVVLCVGSIEGRKNHVALLDACEQLWEKNLSFILRIIGLTHPQTGQPARERLQTLQAKGRTLRYDGPVNDATLASAYSECAFTVYPSLIEGFGLPVLESLSYGKPCICSARGALGESARGGGCLTLDQVDSSSLASAIEQLLADSAKRAELSLAAQKRRFKSWADYAREFTDWMSGVSRRPA